MPAEIPGRDDRDAAQRVAGIILAGGLSQRMGGGDKGLLDLDGRSMLAHVIDRLRPQVQSMAINANGDATRFAAFALPVIADTVAGFPGPLAGVLAGMRWAAQQSPPHGRIVTAPADAPLLPRDLVARLAAEAGDDPDAIVVAQSNGEIHPVIGLWPVALADDLEQSLKDGVRHVRRWGARHRMRSVAFAPILIAGHPVDPFYNANTPEELAALRSVLAKGSP